MSIADKSNSKTYLVPVVYQMMGYVEVEASSPKEAKEFAAEHWDELPLPDNAEYLEGSFEVDMDGVCFCEGKPAFDGD